MDSLFLIYLLPVIFCIIFSGPIRFQEKTITQLTTLSLLLPALTSFFVFYDAVTIKIFPIEKKLFSFEVFSHEFPITIWIDKYSIGMLFLTHLLGLLVVKFSHGYLHLEKGYQRFFSTILFFIFGMYLISLAGTIDLFFAGWEIVGLSSFLLIAFYRSHSRSVQNAWRIYNIYRVCDVGLLLGAVMGHLLWHEATRFSILQHLSTSDFSGIHSTGIILISLMVIFASLGKSAQFPFHNWPSRAMEGPTPSSAIFYGALSIHAGVFLLLRTYPLWSHFIEMRFLVGTIGALTFVMSTLQEKVQSNIKGQIAFSNTANIGIMFCELSLGFIDLVMFHVFCHALYRCFQILVSPSIVLNSLTINNRVVTQRMKNTSKINNTLFSLAMSDFFLDPSWRGLSFLGWKKIYWVIRKVLSIPVFIVLLVFILTCLVNLKFDLPLFLSCCSLLYSLRSILLNHNPFSSMLEMSVSILLLMFSSYIINAHNLHGVKIYMFSILPALICGTFISYIFRGFDLRNYHAKGTDRPILANLFFVCFMIIAGMPISTAFIGEDVLLEDIINYSIPMAGIMTVCIMISGLVCVKIFTRIFMGRPVYQSQI